MPLRIEDYALIGDTQTAALVGTRRLDRLAVPAALRLAGVLRRPAGRRGARPLALAPAERRAERTERRYRDGTLVLETDFDTAERRGPGHRLHADPRRGARRRRASSRARGPRRRCAMELVLRFDYGRVVPWVRRADGRRAARRSPARTPLHLRPRSPTRGRGSDHGARSSSSRGRAGAVRAHLVPVARAGARARRRDRGDRETDGVVGGRGRARCTYERPAPRRSSSAR